MPGAKTLNTLVFLASLAANAVHAQDHKSPKLAFLAYCLPDINCCMIALKSNVAAFCTGG